MFRPHTNVETILVVLHVDRRGSVAFIDARERDDGRSATETLARSAEILADLLDRHGSGSEHLSGLGEGRAFVRGDDEIRRNGYSLLAKTYRPEERPSTAPGSPAELLREIRETEDQIAVHIADLSKRLADRAPGG